MRKPLGLLLLIFVPIIVGVYFIREMSVSVENEDCFSQGKGASLVSANNIFNEALQPCCLDPMTGYFRNGYCETNATDYGRHIVCAIVDDDFLQYSKSLGNDLISPRPGRNFPGLKAGDKWCLCISRWIEAVEAGVGPKIDPHATHENCTKVVPIQTLLDYSLD